MRVLSRGVSFLPLLLSPLSLVCGDRYSFPSLCASSSKFTLSGKDASGGSTLRLDARMRLVHGSKLRFDVSLFFFCFPPCALLHK